MTTMSILPHNVSADKIAPRVDFETFMRLFVWRQGQHVGLFGATESGKTTLALSLLPKRKYVTVLATKPRDDTMTKLKATGYVVWKKWKKQDPDYTPRRILWPDIRNLDDATVANQRIVIRNAMRAIYGEQSWCVYADELWYLIHHLGLEKEVKTYLLQARSLGISFIGATQRPAFIPLEMYDQSSHLFFWRDNDERNLQRIGGLANASSQTVRGLVSSLDEHEFLYVPRRGVMLRSKAPFEKGKVK